MAPVLLSSWPVFFSSHFHLWNNTKIKETNKVSRLFFIKNDSCHRKNWCSCIYFSKEIRKSFYPFFALCFIFLHGVHKYTEWERERVRDINKNDSDRTDRWPFKRASSYTYNRRTQRIFASECDVRIYICVGTHWAPGTYYGGAGPLLNNIQHDSWEREKEEWRIACACEMSLIPFGLSVCVCVKYFSLACDPTPADACDVLLLLFQFWI